MLCHNRRWNRDYTAWRRCVPEHSSDGGDCARSHGSNHPQFWSLSGGRSNGKKRLSRVTAACDDPKVYLPIHACRRLRRSSGQEVIIRYPRLTDEFA